MTREKSLKGYDTIRIRLLDSTMESVVQVAGVIDVSIAVGNNARVHTRAVAVPDLEESFRHRLARVHIDDLNVERKRYTRLILGDVLADELALDPVGTLSRLGTQNAAVVAGEENAWVRVDGDASEVGLMIGSEDAVKVAGTEIGLLC
jgi:hypothetical protein